MRECENLNWPPVFSETELPEDILAGLVHEFRHPINAIIGYTALVLHKGFDGREAAERILKLAENMEVVRGAVVSYLQARDGLAGE